MSLNRLAEIESRLNTSNFSNLNGGQEVKTKDGNGKIMECFEKEVFGQDWRKNGRECIYYRIELDNGIQNNYYPNEILKLIN